MREPHGVRLCGNLHRLWMVLIAVIAILLGVCDPVGAQAPKYVAYVSNQLANDVTAIDLSTRSVIAAIPVGRDPTGITASRDGSTVYVANLLDGTVSVIDTASNTVRATISMPAAADGTPPSAFDVAVTPNGKFVYVSNGRISADAAVYVVDTTAQSVVQTISGLGMGPSGVGMSPDGSTLYVLNNAFENDSISVISTGVNAVVNTVPMPLPHGLGPFEIAIAPNGSSALITSELYGTLSVLDTALDVISSYSTVGHTARGIAISPDGATAYVGASGTDGSGNPSNITIVGAASQVPTAQLLLGPDIAPAAIAVTPDGSQLLAADGVNNYLSIVNASTNALIQTVSTDRSPVRITIATIGAPVVLTSSAAVSGKPGLNGWYVGPVEVAFTASGEVGAGVAYTVNGGSAQPYAGPINLTADGLYTLMYWAVDSHGNSEQIHHTLSISLDSTPPAITIAASPSVISSRGHRLLPVTISGKVVDSGSGINPSSAAFTVHDEYGEINTAGPVSVEANGSYSFTVSLPAWRRPRDRDGRHYVVTISASDVAGNTGSGSITVVVLRDESGDHDRDDHDRKHDHR